MEDLAEDAVDGCAARGEGYECLVNLWVSGSGLELEFLCVDVFQFLGWSVL